MAEIEVEETTIEAFFEGTSVEVVVDNTTIEAVYDNTVIEAVPEVVETIIIEVAEQGPAGPPGSGVETYTHPNFITTAARDLYYTLNPTLLLDELIVTVNNGSIRDMWQYKLSTLTWIAIGSGSGGTETFTHPKYLSVAARDAYYVSNPSLLLDNLIVTVVNTSDFTLNDVWQYDLANTVWRSCGIHSASDITDFDAEVSNNIDVAFNTAHSTGDGSDHSDVALNNNHRAQVTGDPHNVAAGLSDLDHATVHDPASLLWSDAGHSLDEDGTENYDAIRYGQPLDQMLHSVITNAGGDVTNNNLVRFRFDTDDHYGQSTAPFLREPLMLSSGRRLTSDAETNAQVDFHMYGGDLVAGAALLPEIPTIDASLRGAKNLFYMPGNHDIEADDNEWRTEVDSVMTPVTWGGVGNINYYSFESNGLLIIVLDPNENEAGGYEGINWTIGSAQRAWLTALLTNNPTTPAIVFSHITLSDAPTDPYYKVTNGAAVRTIIETYGNVVAMISGHAHWDIPETGGNDYEVVNGIKYFIVTASSPLSATTCYESREGCIFTINLVTGAVYKEAVGTAVLMVGTSSGTRSIFDTLVKYYANPSGSDDNDGLTLATAFATIAHSETVLKTFPDETLKRLFISGNFEVSEVSLELTRLINCVVTGDDAVAPETGTISTVNEDLANKYISDSSKTGGLAWDATGKGEYATWIVKMTSGTDTGLISLVEYNGTATLYLIGDPFPNAQVGDTFEVYTPPTILPYILFTNCLVDLTNCSGPSSGGSIGTQRDTILNVNGCRFPASISAGTGSVALGSGETNLNNTFINNSFRALILSQNARCIENSSLVKGRTVLSNLGNLSVLYGSKHDGTDVLDTNPLFDINSLSAVSFHFSTDVGVQASVHDAPGWGIIKDGTSAVNNETFVSYSGNTLGDYTAEKVVTDDGIEKIDGTVLLDSAGNAISSTTATTVDLTATYAGATYLVSSNVVGASKELQLNTTGPTILEVTTVCDGSTSPVATVLTDAMNLIINDAGIMKQVLLTYLNDYINSKKSFAQFDLTVDSAAALGWQQVVYNSTVISHPDYTLNAGVISFDPGIYLVSYATLLRSAAAVGGTVYTQFATTGTTISPTNLSSPVKVTGLYDPVTLSAIAEENSLGDTFMIEFTGGTPSLALWVNGGGVITQQIKQFGTQINILKLQ